MAKKKQYEVGYGKPPVNTRFKKGESGNKSGRPRDSRNKMRDDTFSSVFLEESRRLIEVKDNGAIKMMPNDRALIRKIIGMAGTGDMRAMKLVLDHLSVQENKKKEKERHLFTSAVEFKSYWAAELERRRLRGEPDPKFLWHPDDFHLNYETGTVIYRGMTVTQKIFIDRLMQMKAFFQGALIRLSELSAPQDPEDITFLWEDLRHISFMLEKIDAALDMPWERTVDKCPDQKEINELKRKVLEELEARSKFSRKRS